MKRPPILLVEDNRDDVELTLHALKECGLGFPIVVASDGEEALDYLFGRGIYINRDTRDRPVMILLDLQLPRVDGLQVLRALRDSGLPGHIPVVALTTSDEENDIISAYKLGVNSYIRKPIDFDQFRETVKQVGRYWLSSNTMPPSIGPYHG